MPANHCIPHTEETKRKISASKKGIPLYRKRRPSIYDNGLEYYRCFCCGGFFLREDFYKNKRTLLGLTSECKKCHTKISIKSRDKETSRIAFKKIQQLGFG